MSSLEIEVDVNGGYINRVSPGQRITAVLDAYPDWRIPGKVITMVPTADRQKATVLVRIAFDKLNPPILPYMGIEVNLPRHRDGGDEERAAAWPLQNGAVPHGGDSNVVFVVSGGDRVERRAVRIVGAAPDDRIQGLSGLSPSKRGTSC